MKRKVAFGLWLALVWATQGVASAQSSDTFSLRLDGCEARGLVPSEVAHAVELETQSLGIDITSSDDAPLRARVGCDGPDDSVLSLGAELAGSNAEERRVSVADVAPPHRARVVAMVLAEMIAGLMARAPSPEPTPVDGRVTAPEVTPLDEPASPPGTPSESETPAPPPEPLEAEANPTDPPSMALASPYPRAAGPLVSGVGTFGLGATLVPVQTQLFGSVAGGLAGQIGCDLARLRFGAAADLAFTEIGRSAGTVDLFTVTLSLFLEGGLRVDPWEFGARLEAQSGIFASTGRNLAAGHSASTPLDPLFALSALSFAQLHVSPTWFVRVDVGATFVVAGVRVRAADEEILSWTGVLVPFRLAVGADF